MITKKSKLESFLPKKIDTLSKNDIEEIAIKIIANLDFKSKKQMQILNSIPSTRILFVGI